MKTEINETEAKAALGEKEIEAEALLADEGKTRETLKSAEGLLDKLKKVPVFGKIIDDVVTAIQMVKDYIDGKYRRVPKRVIISVLAGFLYIISPVDLIPDFIPIVGWLDDFTVFSLILNAGLYGELMKYREWKDSLNSDPVYEPIWPEADEEDSHDESNG